MVLSSPVFVDEDKSSSVFEDLVEKEVKPEDDFPTSASDLRYQALAEQIERAADLQPDWDSYGAEPPNHETVLLAATALDFAAYVRALPATIAAAVDGGLALCWDSRDRHAYIEFGNDGSIVIARYEGTSSPQVTEISRKGVVDALFSVKDYMQQ